MGHSNEFWTEEKLELLIKLKAEGLSNSATAKRLRCTTNMVGGKYWRLNRLGLIPKKEKAPTLYSGPSAPRIPKCVLLAQEDRQETGLPSPSHRRYG